MVLLDTSVWIEVFRRPSRLTLTSVAEIDEVVTCLPVVQEVLQGFRDEAAFRVAHDSMLAFPIVESPLIAACALRHGLTVAHHDRDFDAIAEVSSLHVRSVSVAR